MTRLDQRGAQAFAFIAAAIVGGLALAVWDWRTMASRKKKARPRAKRPIMTHETERFLAFEGLVQWTQCVVTQGQRIQDSQDPFNLDMSVPHDATALRLAGAASRSEQYLFVIAANKLFEHRAWVLRFGLCTGVDFSEFDKFPASNIKDLRDMGEHQRDYFGGGGHFPERWVVTTPGGGSSDASSGGTMIGGRLDWKKFAAAAERLLPKLLAEPIPYPPPTIPAGDVGPAAPP